MGAASAALAPDARGQDPRRARKLDLHTMAELTKFAIREGLTSP